MVKKKVILLPTPKKAITTMGDNIRLARLRRKISAEMVAQRAHIGRATYGRIESGDPGVSIGVIAKVLFVLGLHNDLAILAKDDAFGRKLQDADIAIKGRAPKGE